MAGCIGEDWDRLEYCTFQTVSSGRLIVTRDVIGSPVIGSLPDVMRDSEPIEWRIEGYREYGKRRLVADDGCGVRMAREPLEWPISTFLTYIQADICIFFLGNRASITQNRFAGGSIGVTRLTGSSSSESAVTRDELPV